MSILYFDKSTNEYVHAVASVSFRYHGDYKDGKDYSVGDVVLKDGHTQVFNGSKWEIIDSGVDEYSELKALKCMNCGAPLRYHNGKLLKCYYCGTEYGKEKK